MSSIMPTIISGADADAMFKSDAHIDASKKRVRVLQKLIKHTPQNLFRFCDVRVADGHQLDGDCCAPIPKETLHKVAKDFSVMLLLGIPFADDLSQKQQSSIPCWKFGCFGSIWIDMKAEEYGLDYIRVAYHKEEDEEQHQFRIVCEKAA